MEHTHGRNNLGGKPLTTGGLLFLAVGLTAALGALAVAQAPKRTPASVPTAAQAEFYKSQVEPILKASCLTCHGGGADSSGKLGLQSRSALLKGGVSGTAFNKKSPASSLLLKAVDYKGPQMPPSGKLPAEQIRVLRKWILMGAPFVPGAAAAPAASHAPPTVNAQTMKFWSFRPIKNPAPPKVRSAGWVRNPIDSFVLNKLESKGLAPAAPASRGTLIRRATYDLLGIPPSPEEVAAFAADRSPNAYEKLIDRLLASPHYGERWGRHWLDLVRYAETNSFERDGAKPFVWRYRDYVIRSLNDDKPFDTFVREQLAGDEIENPTADSMTATGYYRLGAWDDEPSDPLMAKYEELDDLVGTTSQVLLGLTVNCARCHDHKIDPVPQKDYYRVMAFFHGVRRYGVRSEESVAEGSLRPIATPEERKRYAAESGEHQGKLTALRSEINAIEAPVRADFSPVEKEEFRNPQNRLPIVKKRVPAKLSEEKFEQYAALVKRHEELMANPPKGLTMALAVSESGSKPDPAFVLLRGNPHVKGEAVEPGFPSVLAPPEPVITPTNSEVPTSGRRLALANWIVSSGNQLTARVMANRIWQYHFGRGIVRTPSNFGFLGNPPTHPELLDWLATDLVKGGWRLKRMHKLIMQSNTYRMSSRSNSLALAKDPENDLLWRFDMRRLTAEEVRDSILAANGSLNASAMFGPSIYPTIPEEVHAGQSVPGAGWGKSSPEEAARRSIYIHIKRSLTVPILASFDVPETEFSCPVRFATTQPTQALGMMNSTFLNQQAGIFGDLLRKNAGPTVAERARYALRRVVQREPTPAEVTRGVRLVAQLRAKGASEDEALRLFCVVALNLNEFLYLD